jgi:amino acid transporter
LSATLRAATKADEGLVRGIGPVAMTAAVMNIVVGGGIFVLPSAVAGEVGEAGVLAYVICGTALLLVTCSFAIVGARITHTGGAYAYVEAAFGPFVGYLAGVLTWLSGALASASLIAALVSLAAEADPRLQTATARLLLVVIVYAAPVVLNLFAIRIGSRLIVATTAVKLATLLFFLVIASQAVDAANLRWPDTVDAGHLGRATILILFALAGMEMAVGASGEIRDSRRTVPIGMLGGVALVVVLYVAIHLVAQGVLGARLPGSPAPLADAVGAALPAGRRLMIGGMVFSMVGNLAGTLLGCSRILYAFGRDGILPRALAALHPRTRIPAAAVLLQAAITMLFAATRTFAKLAILASVTIAILYGMVCCAAFLFAERAPERPSPARSVLLRRLVAALGVIAMLWLAAQSTWHELGSVVGTLLVASLLFVVSRRARAPA